MATSSSETTGLRAKYTLRSNGHKRWEAPQVESIILAETEIRKGTYIVRHSFLGKDIPKQKHDESHAFLTTTGSNIHY